MSTETVKDEVDTTRRVKVYHRSSSGQSMQWERMEIGYVSMEFTASIRTQGAFQIVVRSEDDGSILLESEILLDREYQIEEEIIAWAEDDDNDMALGFQEENGCKEFWSKICQAQGRSPVAVEAQKHYAAYQQALLSGLRINLKYLKLLLSGPPRSGKTSMRRRLVGELINLMDEAVQPSTGAIDSHNVLVKLDEEKLTQSTTVITESTWSTLKQGSKLQSHQSDTTDLDEELHLLYHVITESTAHISRFHFELSNPGEHPEDSATRYSHKDTEFQDPVRIDVRKISEFEKKEIEEAFVAYEKVLKSNAGRKEIRSLLEKIILLNMVDTGGQPAFMEMLPMLTIGPALYLIFLRLDQELKKRYPIQYLSDENEEVPLGQSSYSSQEIIFQVLSSIACCRSEDSSAASKEPIVSSDSQAVMLVGTYKDKLDGSPNAVSSKIKEIDRALQEDLRDILDTDLLHLDKNLLRYASDDQLIFDADNMTGDEDEIRKIRKRLEEVILQEFEEVPIPASWLMFSIFIRKMGKPIMSMSQCKEIGHRLRVGDIREALWFLHHCIGIFMHYPDVEELKDMVICDPQIIFDSVTELILNTFSLRVLQKAVCDKFKQAGQFRFRDIQKVSKKLKTDILSFAQLVKLLQHLSIIAPISPSASTEISTAHNEPSDDNIVYFMPAVLAPAQEHELSVPHTSVDPAPLMIRFKSGYIPFGLFCALIAHLVGQRDNLGWILQEPRPGRHHHILRRNRVTFRIDNTYDVTLVSKPKCYEVHIAAVSTHKSRSEDICCRVIETICQSLDRLLMQMRHKLYLIRSTASQTLYEIGFQCPKHPDDDHMIVNRPLTESSISSESALHLWNNYTNGKTAMVCISEEVCVDLTTIENQINMCWFVSHSMSDQPQGNTESIIPHPPAKRPKLQFSKPQCLTEREHLKICMYLTHLEEQDIIRLGQALGLQRSKLKKMKHLPDDMVDAWLNKEDDVLETSGPPTWESLCKHLRYIDQNGIAASIEEREIKGMNLSKTSISQ